MTDATLRDAEQLSLLVDGELDPAGVERACALWQAGANSHAAWHVYHLIGDVLRSEDLASAPQRDHQALDQLRRRLASEPVHIAPATAVKAPASPVRSRRQTWGTLAAVAAGFAAVAGVLVVVRTAGVPESPVVGLAAAPIGPVQGAGPTDVRQTEPEHLVLAADGKLMRDTRLDRYLDAHKHFSGSSALGVPSSFLRAATSDAASR